MRDLRLPLAALLTAAIAAPVALGAEGPIPAGTYEGKGVGVKASVVVAESGDGSLRYSLKTSCGRSRGVVSLKGSPGGTLKGKRRAGKSTLVARLEETGDGGELSGSLRSVTKVRSKDGSKRKCRAKSSFSAAADGSTSPGPADPDALAGHYAGSGVDGGRPVSFDVDYDPKGEAFEITALSFETDTECWDDLDEDGEDDTLVVRISGLEGEVDQDGYFEIDYSPDADSNFYVVGTLEDGKAEMDIEVGGFFAADGTPMTGGPYECDSWGEVYTASRQG